MGRRGKVILQPITDETKRRACLKKRLTGFFKKASELSTMCDAEIAAVVYCPDDALPKHWPSDPNRVMGTIQKFLMKPEVERTSTQLDQKDFIIHMINRSKETEKLLIKKNEERYAKYLISMLHEGQIKRYELDPEQSRIVYEYANAKAQILREKIEGLRAMQPPPPPPPPPPPDGAGPSVTSGDGGYGDEMEISTAVDHGGYGGHMATPSAATDVGLVDQQQYEAIYNDLLNSL